MQTAMVAVRVALALACVLGLIWFAGRKLSGPGGARRAREVPMTVIGRQPLGKGSAIALVEVAGRVLLLGVGERGVHLLTEIDVPDPGALTASTREELDQRSLERTVLDGVPLTGVSLGAHAMGAHAMGAHAMGAHATDTYAPGTPATDAYAPAAGMRDRDQLRTHEPAPTPDLESLGAFRRPDVPEGRLSGSILSPGTWRRAIDVVQQRTVRR